MKKQIKRSWERELERKILWLHFVLAKKEEYLIKKIKSTTTSSANTPLENDTPFFTALLRWLSLPLGSAAIITAASGAHCRETAELSVH